MPCQGSVVGMGNNEVQPCFFAAGSRQWFRLHGGRGRNRLDCFLAFVCEPHVRVLGSSVDYFGVRVPGDTSSAAEACVHRSISQWASPSVIGGLLRWPIDEMNESEPCIDVLVDFYDANEASIWAFGTDVSAAGKKERRVSWAAPILTGLQLQQHGGGFLAVMTHSKLSSFGHVRIGVTPPQAVAIIDLTRRVFG